MNWGYVFFHTGVIIMHVLLTACIYIYIIGKELGVIMSHINYYGLDTAHTHTPCRTICKAGGGARGA